MTQDLLAQSVTPADLDALIEGACFLASGGGGPKAMAQAFRKKIEHNVTMVAPEQVLDGDASLMVVDLGSPAKALDGIGFTAPVNAFNALSDSLAISPSYLLPGEIGAVNTLLPFYIADYIYKKTGKKLRVIDSDPCGRADPRLSETLLNISGQSCCPAIIASDTDDCGHFEKAFFKGPMTPEQLEAAAREEVSKPAYDEVGGMALYPLPGTFVRSEGSNFLVHNSVSKAILVGDALLTNPSDQELSLLLTGMGIANYAFVTGTITSLTRNTSDGFDNGKVVIEGDCGNTFWVFMRNESLLAWNNTQGRLHALAPDCINMLVHDGEKRRSISNASIEEGQRISLWGTAGPSKVAHADKLVELFSEDINAVLDKFPEDKKRIGFTHYIPIEQLNAND